MALTWRAGALAALGAVFVGLVLPSWSGIALVAAVVAVGVMVDVALAGPVRTLEFERGGDTTVRLGATARVQLVVTNPSGRRVRALIRDAWPPSAGLQGSHGPRIAWLIRRSSSLGTRSRSRPASGDGSSPSWSLHAAGTATPSTSASAPSDRWDWRHDSADAQSVAHPGTAALPVAPPPPSRLARLRELDGRTSLLVRGQGTEFDSLRDYTVGDDVRSIDWRATARRHVGDHYDVVVRTWRPERDRAILIVLDTGRTAAGRIGTEELGTDGVRLDAALDAALLLTALALRAGDRVDLLAYDRRIRAAVTRTAASQTLAQVTNAMAVLEPELVELDARGLVTTVLNRAPHRALVVLLTSLDSAPMTEGLLPVIGRLTARHEVVVASVADPRIEHMAHGRGDATAVYEAASAERARAERRHVADLLAKHRVTVVDQPPTLIAPALADAYLALKAAGRL